MNTPLTISIALLLSAVGTASASGRLTSVDVDLDGDGAVDTATLAEGKGGVVVSVRMAGKQRDAEWFEFAIAADRRDAVCALPATLKTAPLDCDASGGSLEGCDAAKTKSMLLLSGGDCDAIRIYWNVDAQKLTWWRR